MKKILFSLALLSGALFASAQEIATWSGFRKAAVTFTFDDGAPSHINDAAPLFDSFGYKATFYLVSNWNPDWEAFQQMANNGHEIGSHSKSHGQNMTGEEASSKVAIESQIQQQYGCISVAYPNCNVPDVEAVQQNYIAGRICNGSWAGIEDIMGPRGPEDWCRVPAIMTGSNGISSGVQIRDAMTNARNRNGWVVFLTHGFQGKENGSATYSPTDLAAINDALRWAQQNDNDIWVTSLKNAAMYCKERQAASFEEIARDESSVTYALTHTIADDVCAYEYPLSLRLRQQTEWTDWDLLQGERPLEYKLEDGYTYFEAIPNNGNIVIRNHAPEAITDIPADAAPRKIIRNGHFYILRNGRLFTLSAQQLK